MKSAARQILATFRTLMCPLCLPIASSMAIPNHNPSEKCNSPAYSKTPHLGPCGCEENPYDEPDYARAIKNTKTRTKSRNEDGRLQFWKQSIQNWIHSASFPYAYTLNAYPVGLDHHTTSDLSLVYGVECVHRLFIYTHVWPRLRYGV